MSLPPQSSILCEDLLVQILSLLPVKSLVRFKCVSKSLKSLISNPSFVKLHLQRSRKNVNLLIKLKDPLQNLSILSCSILENPSSIIVEELGHHYQTNSEHRYDIIGSCNGLVCLVAGSLNDSNKEYQVCLWNPATGLISQKSSRLLIHHESGYFNHIFGFGYDGLSDNYKVVVILCKFGYYKEVVQTKVYKVGDNCWKNIESFMDIPDLQKTGVYLSGALSWLANLSSNYLYLIIVSLDLGKETYERFSLPGGLDQLCYPKPSLGVLKDCLCLCHHYTGFDLAVWQMKKHGNENSWTQLFNINFQNLQFNSLEDYPLKLGTFKNGRILIMTKDRRVLATTYSQRDNEVEDAKISNTILWIDAMDYVQSLVSPIDIK